MVATKQRMVESAAGLLQRRGLAATSFTEVLAESGAARGAIYHHFPGGKAELARDAVAWTGERVRDAFAALEADDPAGVVDAFLRAVRPAVQRSAEGTSCAIAAVVVEVSPLGSDLSRAAGQGLGSWVHALAGRLEVAGMAEPGRTALATLLITFLEGAHVMCRAAGSAEPFDRSVRALRLAVDGAVGLPAP